MYAVHPFSMGRTARTKAVILIAAVAAALIVGLMLFQQRTRIITGTWLWQFEGSDFFEGRLPDRECQLYRGESAWLNYNPKGVYPSYTYKRKWPSSGIYDSRRYGHYRIEAFEVKFRGRKRSSFFGTGHLGGWNSEYDVDEMLSVKPISGLHCNVP